jgi:exonuclease SbcC
VVFEHFSPQQILWGLTVTNSEIPYCRYTQTVCATIKNTKQITESNQNFFFLDEGFGSLDKESLAVVFDTLKTLRKENRIVGVISHVEEMQQEIDVHLRIENDENRGSLINRSWME